MPDNSAACELAAAWWWLGGVVPEMLVSTGEPPEPEEELPRRCHVAVDGEVREGEGDVLLRTPPIAMGEEDAEDPPEGAR